MLHTPVELRQDVVEQHVAQRLEVLGEDVADGVKCVVAGGGHPLGFLQGSGGAGSTRAVSLEVLKQTPPKQTRTMADLGLLLGQLHVVEDPEDDSEQVLPPVFLEGVSVSLHHFKHHGQAPGTQTRTVAIHNV